MKISKSIPFFLAAGLLIATPVFAKDLPGNESHGGPPPFQMRPQGDDSEASRGGQPFNQFRGPKPEMSSMPGMMEGDQDKNASMGGRIPGRPDFKDGSSSGRSQACQAQENGIKNRSSQLVLMVNNMIATFDTIASRVESFYTTTLSPTGKTVSNYDSLVSDIQTKETAAKTALTTAQADQQNFSCSASDPKTQISQFNTDMKNVKQALEDYRSSIKDLIVAVRTAAGKEGDTTASGSAQPE